MPWSSLELETIIQQAQTLIKTHFFIDLNANIFVVTQEEITAGCIDELVSTGYSFEAIEILKTEFIPKVIGKYFKQSNEIWVVVKIGENVDTIIHEYLHSIQKCNPNREGIVDFITYRLTGNKMYIDTFELKDWLEIEKTNSFLQIKQKLVTPGDCEEF